jgi:DNA-directed RNA polymerase subunit RPC12/RpoP
MLERIGSVGKWRCTDCGHDFISEKRPRPTRCPKPGCRAPANGHKRAAKPRLPAEIACKRCGIREARPGRSECVPCAWDRRRVQRELYWKRRGMAVPPDHSPGVDVTAKLISENTSGQD